MNQRLRGFTLVELVVIIMIIGILAVFASGRFADESSFDARGFTDELSGALRYAQRYAVASGCGVQFQLNANSYALTVANPCPAGGIGNAVQSPGGQAFAGSAPSGVTASNATFVFNPYGDVAGGGSITVSGGGTNLNITVTANSGFVVAP